MRNLFFSKYSCVTPVNTVVTANSAIFIPVTRRVKGCNFIPVTRRVKGYTIPVTRRVKGYTSKVCNRQKEAFPIVGKYVTGRRKRTPESM